jgi:hypothetical protein
MSYLGGDPTQRFFATDVLEHRRGLSKVDQLFDIQQPDNIEEDVIWKSR